MSYTEKWEIRITNDDVKFEANVRVGDKETSKKFITHSSSQNVNATNELADGAFMGGVGLVPVIQGVYDWQNLLSTKFHS